MYFSISGHEGSYVFKIGATQLVYKATDREGNEAECTRNIEVKGK